MKTKQSHNFREMPTDLDVLAGRSFRRSIHDKASYKGTAKIVDVFAGFEECMTGGQNDYFDLLYDIIEKREHEP